MKLTREVVEEKRGVAAAQTVVLLEIIKPEIHQLLNFIFISLKGTFLSLIQQTSQHILPVDSVHNFRLY